jgi:hypothetical protein
MALLAWLPIAAFLALATPANEEIAAQVMIAVSLAAFVAIPRLAYIGAVAAVGMLVVGAVAAGAFAVTGIGVPSPVSLIVLIGGAFGIGYLVIAGLVALGPPALRPWS